MSLKLKEMINGIIDTTIFKGTQTPLKVKYTYL